MNTSSFPHRRRGSKLWEFVRSELAPFPGRYHAVLRYLLISATVILTSMSLQVPFLALSLIMVFFTAQENTVLTRQSGIVLTLGTTLAVTLCLLLLKLTIDDPLARILGAALIGFCGMYFLRINKLGTIGYLIALFLISLQSLADQSIGPEALTRALLWTWVAVTYPIAVTIAVNVLMLPAKPTQLLNDELVRQLDVAITQLRAALTHAERTPLPLSQIERGVLTLHKHLQFAVRADYRYLQNKALHLARINTVDRLHTAAVKLSRLPNDSSLNTQQSLLVTLETTCEAVRSHLLNGTPLPAQGIALNDDHSKHPGVAILYEMAHALNAFIEAEQIPFSATSITKEKNLVADAFTNPVYAQFALKTMFATFFCYVLYTAVQWPGIHTSMLTCLIMALPSLGASSHRGLLRIAGCMIGSLLALLSTVFLLPHLDSIVGLLAIALPVIALGAWIAAGSARSNYIGTQLVFAYALALLGQFEPTVNLNEIRDRMLGILLGIVVSITIYSLIWPETEQSELRKNLARLLRSVAGLARSDARATIVPGVPRPLDQARLKSWSLLAQNRDMQARVALEPSWQYAHNSVTVEMQTWLAQIQETLFSINWLQTQLSHSATLLSAELHAALLTFNQAAATQLEHMAAVFENGPAAHGETSFSSFQQTYQQQYQRALEEERLSPQASETLAAANAVYGCLQQLRNHLPATQPGKAS